MSMKNRKVLAFSFQLELYKTLFEYVFISDCKFLNSLFLFQFNDFYGSFHFCPRIFNCEYEYKST